ncbi:MAG: stage 0 sporulation family protein [Clostridiales bacterium]|nr:stage 0 sporulation family protein [Clostridiales bacterium]
MNNNRNKKKKNRPGTPAGIKKSRHNRYYRKRQQKIVQPDSDRSLTNAPELKDDTLKITDNTDLSHGAPGNSAGQNITCEGDCGFSGISPLKCTAAQKFILPDLSAFDFADELPAPKVIDDADAVEVVGVRFKRNGKVYYFAPGEIITYCGEHVIVETARGLEYGEVCMANKKVASKDIVLPLRPVIRLATPEDTEHHEQNKEKEKEAFEICLGKIAKHGLEMKLVDVQYTFDNTKLLFYFTAPGRVDFRELVRDLASVFRTRIELRQIGIRDEAKLMGGIGACGRKLCCSSFLSDFVQVSIRMAKEQNLSLNSNKISGVCGRLMCCLRYEYDNYVDEIKKTPPVDSVVRTEDGEGVVTEINPLAGTVKVRLSDKPELPPKSYGRDNVAVISMPQNTDRNGNNSDNDQNGGSGEQDV